MSSLKCDNNGTGGVIKLLDKPIDEGLRMKVEISLFPLFSSPASVCFCESLVSVL